MLTDPNGYRTIVYEKAGTSGITGAVVAITKLTGAGTFTPNANTKAMLVFGCGGGGAGGGASNTVDSAGGGGNAGQEFIDVITSISPSYSYSAGVGGTGVAGGSGGNGAQTTFGPPNNASKWLLQGGAGGVAGSTSAAPRVTGTNSTSLTLQTSGVQASQCRPGNSGKNYSSTVTHGGRGASGRYGSGGAPRTTDGAGNAATGHGSGGGGARSVAAGTNRAGGNGTAGCVLVIEFK